jgi:hypothetical protein
VVVVVVEKVGVVMEAAAVVVAEMKVLEAVGMMVVVEVMIQARIGEDLQEEEVEVEIQQA